MVNIDRLLREGQAKSEEMTILIRKAQASMLEAEAKLASIEAANQSRLAEKDEALRVLRDMVVVLRKERDESLDEQSSINESVLNMNSILREVEGNG